MGFVILAILVIAFIVVITNLSVVQQSRAYVSERLGAFHSVWGVGCLLYTSVKDVFTCPHGQELRHTTTDRDGKRIYRSTPKYCCLLYTSGSVPGRPLSWP